MTIALLLLALNTPVGHDGCFANDDGVVFCPKPPPYAFEQADRADPQRSEAVKAWIEQHAAKFSKD